MSMPTDPVLSIIIPAYNEEGTIGNTLEKIAAYVRRPGFPTVEVIVSVGAGTDDTFNEAASKQHLFSNFIVLENGSPADKGRNVKLGMLQARGDFCMYMDADLSTPLHHLEKMLEHLQKYDVVIAQRNVETIHTGHRKFISTFGNMLVQAILLPGIKDTQCGFKGFRRTAARHLFAQQRIISWGFDMEILALARKMGYTRKSFHVADWHEVNKGGELDSGIIKAFKAALMTFVDLFRIRLSILFRSYDFMKSGKDVREWSS